MTSNSRQPWTAEEDRRLLAMAIAGKSTRFIALRLRRTPVAVKARAHSLRVPLAGYRIKSTAPDC
jgi:hypothetical protein